MPTPPFLGDSSPLTQPPPEEKEPRSLQSPWLECVSEEVEEGGGVAGGVAGFTSSGGVLMVAAVVVVDGGGVRGVEGVVGKLGEG